MASSSSLSNTGHRIVSSAIVQAVAEDIVLEHFPGIEDRPKVFYGYILGTAALIQPGIEALAQAYKLACCSGPNGREGALRFLSVMLEAEGEA